VNQHPSVELAEVGVVLNHEDAMGWVRLVAIWLGGGLAARSFKKCVHRNEKMLSGPGSRNNKAIVSSKLNQMRIDGGPHNSFGFLSAAGVVNGRDQITKRQWLLLVIEHHGMRIGRETARALWGVSPI
jgi:hypothetical protein